MEAAQSFESFLHVFQAHRLLYQLTLGSRAMKTKKYTKTNANPLKPWAGGAPGGGHLPRVIYHQYTSVRRQTPEALDRWAARWRPRSRSDHSIMKNVFTQLGPSIGFTTDTPLPQSSAPSRRATPLVWGLTVHPGQVGSPVEAAQSFESFLHNADEGLLMRHLVCSGVWVLGSGVLGLGSMV